MLVAEVSRLYGRAGGDLKTHPGAIHALIGLKRSGKTVVFNDIAKFSGRPANTAFLELRI